MDQNVNNELYEAVRGGAANSEHMHATLCSPSTSVNTTHDVMYAREHPVLMHPLDEQNMSNIHSEKNSPEQGIYSEHSEPQAEDAPVKPKFPAYSKVNLLDKKRKREISNDESKRTDSPSRTDSDSDNTDDPPCIPPYHPDHDDISSPSHIASFHNDSFNYEFTHDQADHSGDSKELLITTEENDDNSAPVCGEEWELSKPPPSVVEGDDVY